ncbi:MAG TPA: FecR domain-containing protein [Puia sp.]|nr:FecR domain-containing protein [Puia sp.]
MDSRPTNEELPWQLIVSALQGELSPEEDLHLEEWLAASPANREKYERLVKIWKEEISDYGIYHQANETQAWETLRRKLDTTREEHGKPIIWRWPIAATLVLVTAGATLWYIAGRNHGIQYETAIGEHRTISLPDGSKLDLQPQARIRLAGDYNKATRTIALLAGKVSFEVAHRQQRPFVVQMDAATVRDLGTTFTIDRSADSITVVVSSGRIAFTEKHTGETRELNAGGGLCLYTTMQRQGEIRTIADSSASLRFDNAELSTVIAALQKKFGKKILLRDTSIAQKRLTVHLDGESFDNAIKIVCSSLNLQYSTDSNGMILIK